MAGEFKLTWRVSDGILMDEERYAEMMNLLTRHEDVADEIAFFLAEPSSGAYDPLENVAEKAEVFKKRAKEIRAMGKSVGINVWPSFGKGEAYSISEMRPEVPFRRMVGMDGTVDAGLVCPVSPEFLDYIHQKYVILAKAEPEFIWVDDDARMTDLGGVPYPCFCDDCVKNFENGRFSSREELVEELNKKENRELRHSWSSYGGDRLARFCAEVRAAVDEVDPGIDTPFMSVGPTHTTFSGDFVNKCMTALRSHRGRPGHGFYEDKKLDGMLSKSMEVARQIVDYPGTVTDIFYEEESCPGTQLEKAFRTRVNEVSLALAAGCTGIAMNHMSGNPHVDVLLARELDELHEMRPVWDRYRSFSKGLAWAGMWPAFSWYMTASMDCEKGWFNEYDPDYDITKPEVLGRIGLPITVDKNAACATLLSGKTLHMFSKEELKEVFSGNVFMDVYALRELEKMGLESWAGVKSGAEHYSTVEVLNDHPFNGQFEGFVHSGIYLPAVDLHPLDEKVESLAYSRDAYNNVFGSCLTKYENELGGKVIVSGYDCWRYVGDPHKVWQFHQIAEWMDSPLTMHYAEPMRVSRIQPYLRTDGKRAAVMLVNAFLDSTEPVEMHLRGNMTKAVAVAKDGSDVELACTRREGKLCVQIPKMEAWEILTILAE